MYTYLQPYAPPELTKEHINKRGRLGLYRALNVGRVVAFLGSGATAAYGRPSWKGLVVAAMGAIKEIEDKSPAGGEKDTVAYRDQKRVFDRLHERIMQGAQSPDTLILALGVTEHLASLLDGTDVVRKTIANNLKAGREQAIDKTINTINAIVDSREDPSHLVDRAGPQPSSVRVLMEALGVQRFLTLNYDVEIEREFARILRISNKRTERDDGRGTSTGESFRKLIDPPETGRGKYQGGGSDVSKRSGNDEQEAIAVPASDSLVGFADGLGRSVLSVNLGSDNIGELVNFALMPKRYEAQVFHLHGRFDDPETMVLTDTDYQKRYYGSGETEYSVTEALDTVFAGNDILLVGVGMDEADMFRPLRQFAGTARNRDLTQRTVYNLRERGASFTVRFERIEKGKEDEFRERFRILNFGEARDFIKNDLVTDGEMQKHKPFDYRKHKDETNDEEFALKLKTQYEIYTIFHGSDELRTLLCLCECIDDLGGRLREDARPSDRLRHDQLTNLALMIDVLRKRLAEAYENDEQRLLKLLPDDEYESLGRLLIGSTAGEKCRLSQNTEKLFDGEKLNNDGAEDLGKKLQSFAASYRSLLRSRALDIALEDIQHRRENWWQDWREIPEPRPARFRRAYTDNDTWREHPCLSRHRPAYRKPAVDQIEAIKVLSDLKQLAKGADAEMRKAWHKGVSGARQLPIDGPLPRRVLRFAMARGAGKGSLMHLLQQNAKGGGGSERFVLDGLFEEDDAFRYHGSFLVHLSFSMEFASVIESLAHFVCDAIVGLFADTASRASATRAMRLLVIDQRAMLNPVIDLLVAEGEELKKLSRKRSPAGRRELHDKISKSLYRSLELGDPPWESQLRSHRLELCRIFLSAFGILVRQMGSKDRLFICLSGLDRLCDGNGVAYNPMYRALFRLLTGHGRKYPDESDDAIPLDLVLISGTPDRPIRYLAEEVNEVELNAHQAVRKVPTDYAKVADMDLYLRRWPVVDGFTIADRYWLGANFDLDTNVEISDHRRRDATLAAFQAAFGKLPDKNDQTSPARHLDHLVLDDSASLRRHLARGVALSSWCAGALVIDATDTTTTEALAKRVKDRLLAFDAAADRDGVAGILGEILRLHRSRANLHWDRVDTPRKKKAQVKWPNWHANMLDIILRHLALFPMPVTARVLYGCDEVHFMLQQWLGEPPSKSNPARRTAQNRARCLNKLSGFLDSLAEHSLLIAVEPKSLPDWDARALRRWRHVNRRYILQDQLRDYICRQMDLSVPDRGERNFFQVSLFSDQPKDLPTPTTEHYLLFRSILDRQILQSKRTLWCLHQLQQAMKESDGSGTYALRSAIAGEGLARRLVGDRDPFEEGAAIDPSLPSIAGASQRIRAMYSLLRGSFSIGAITRLDRMDERTKDDEPFERFHGWLRGVTNAAVSFGKLGDVLKLLEGDPGTESPLTLAYPSAAQKDKQVTLKRPTVQVRPPAQPLYRDEFGWLFNERGVIALVRGKLYDAIPLFERAIHVMHHREDARRRDPALHAAVRRVRLNLAIAHLERGNLDRSTQLLNQLVLSVDGGRHFGSTVGRIAEGYLGLVRHVGGDYAGTLESYNSVLKFAESRQMLRLQSIFYRYRADLRRRMQNMERAQIDAQMAVAAAKNAEQRDVFWAARLTEVKLALIEGKIADPSISQRLEDCLSYARAMSMPRLESDAMRLQAELLLSQGDRILAGRLAAAAAATASRHGLRLMKIAGMQTYSRVLDARQNLTNARTVSAEAYREAERRGYLNIGQRQLESSAQLHRP